MQGKLLLIDGHSILSRAFYGIPMLTSSRGIHTNAVYGFLNILFKVIDEEQADHLAVAFDLSRHTFRTELFSGYKGTRKEMPEELREQVPIIQEILKAMNIPILTMEQYEADDILGTIAKGPRRKESPLRCCRETGIFCSLRTRTSRSASPRPPRGERRSSSIILRT